jgi:lysyl-tRNA synthetase class II
MKIAIECQSPLLQGALELFLKNHLVGKKNCNILIRDILPLDNSSENYEIFYIANDELADLKKPFSKLQLISALEKKDKNKLKEEKIDDEINFDILEKRIEMLTQEYQHNIIKAVKAFYEK